MLYSHLWKARKARTSQSQISAAPAKRPHRHPWLYGIGAILPLLIALFVFTPAFAARINGWTGWFQVPAPHPLTTASTPAIVQYSTGQPIPNCTGTCPSIVIQYIFVRQSDNTIDYSTSDRITASSALAPVPGGGLTPNAPTAVQFGPNLYLFVQGTDNFVWVNKFNGNTWSGWSQLHVGIAGSLIPTANGPFAMNFPGAIYLFVRNPSDGTIDLTRTTDGTNWDTLTEVPGGGHTPSTPTATMFGNTLYVFVQGPDNLVWVNTFQVLGGGWSGWSRPLTNGVSFIPTSTSPIAGYDQENGLHLIVRLSDGGIEETKTVFSGNSWGSLTEVPTNGFSPSAPAVSSSTSELFVFVQGTDNTVYENDFAAVIQ